MSVADGLAKVRERIAAAAERSGRTADGVRLVGVVKKVDDSLVQQAVDAGLEDLGENYAADLAERAGRFGPHLRWHYLGAIQTNKARQLRVAGLLHGLFREKEAAALTGASADPWDVLVEVNIAGEQAKQGIEPDDLGDLLELLSAYEGINVKGLMFVAPQAENPEDVRWVFAEGRRLGERFDLPELSMGMSDDFEVAIEEGATIVRVGRAIFGPRKS